ncbi:MAG TPA: ABC transporter ATP-binding protein [Thermodesulfovibrionales bacterium]|nr:ABC transporter ATP-binding protein [Thermodesulfovibrionales bacterium]
MSSAYNLPILELKSICFSYPKSTALIDKLSFSVGEGEFIGLLGANGSGKSTILKLGSGILKASSGDIKLWGKSLRTYQNRDRAKLISYLPQTLDVSVPFTVKELVSMGLYPYDIPPALTADEALEMTGLKDKSDSLLTDLSGGEKRRTFIAMTLLQGAGLLLLDEPLANLDIKYQIELIRLLKRLREERNISIVMALHDINIALQFEKVMLIRDGQVLGIGHPERVLTKDMLKTAFDVTVEISRSDAGKTFVSYENNF